MKKILSTLVMIVAIAGMAQAEPLLTNGDFASGDLKPWKLYTKKGLAQATGTVADGALTVGIDAATTKPHERQLIQEVKVASGTKYLLTFEVKTASAGGEEVIVVLARTKNFEKDHYGMYRKLSPGADWETQKFYFTTRDIDPADPPALKFNLGAFGDDVSFRNLSLKVVGQ